MLANLLKEHCLVEGGDANVSQWLKDEGINAPIGSVLKVILCHTHPNNCALPAIKEQRYKALPNL